MTATGASNPHYVGDFGDERLAAVGADLLRALEEKRTVVVKRLGGTRADEIRYGSFLNNENVTHQEILDVEGRRVGQSAKGRDISGDRGYDGDEFFWSYGQQKGVWHCR